VPDARAAGILVFASYCARKTIGRVCALPRGALVVFGLLAFQRHGFWSVACSLWAVGAMLCYADTAWDWRVYSGMLRRCSCIAFAVMLVGLSAAHAADTTLTLACQGTVTIKTFSPTEYEPDPVSMGLIVNFTNRTVKRRQWTPTPPVPYMSK